jgi:hypothetical protein
MSKVIAKGSFVVDLKPQSQEKIEDITIGRWSIDKKFSGDLEATSKVEMLGVGSESSGKGAYVAIEAITGTLNGLQGSFVLMHNGTRSSNSQQLSVNIISGCSTGQLVGIEGKMTISIVDKKHLYELEYEMSGEGE